MFILGVDAAVSSAAVEATEPYSILVSSEEGRGWRYFPHSSWRKRSGRNRGAAASLSRAIVSAVIEAVHPFEDYAYTVIAFVRHLCSGPGPDDLLVNDARASVMTNGNGPTPGTTIDRTEGTGDNSPYQTETNE